jgi:hypothetical protein
MDYHKNLINFETNSAVHGTRSGSATAYLPAFDYERRGGRIGEKKRYVTLAKKPTGAAHL